MRFAEKSFSQHSPNRVLDEEARAGEKEINANLSFQPTMAARIILMLVALSSALPSNRVPVREILPPTSPNHRHQPQQLREFVPSFQRGAVESPPTPTTFGRLLNDLNYDVFGSHRYPLRDAVESLPANVLNAESRYESRDGLER